MLSIVPGGAKFHVPPEKSRRCLECIVGQAVKSLLTNFDWGQWLYMADQESELLRRMRSLGSEKMTKLDLELRKLPIPLLHPVRMAEVFEILELFEELR